MKNLKSIIIILVVIAVITTAVILIMKKVKDAQRAAQNDPLGIINDGEIPSTSDGNPIAGLDPVARVKLERYCSEPAKRKYVESTYGIKCSDYGF